MPPGSISRQPPEAWTTSPPNHLLLLIGELSSPSPARHAAPAEDKAGVTLACSRSDAWDGGSPRFSATSWMPASVSVGCDVPVAAVAARQWHEALERAGPGTAMEQWPLIAGAGADAQASGGATTWCYPRYPEDSSATCEIIESNHIWKILI